MSCGWRTARHSPISQKNSCAFKDGPATPWIRLGCGCPRKSKKPRFLNGKQGDPKTTKPALQGKPVKGIFQPETPEPQPQRAHYGAKREWPAYTIPIFPVRFASPFNRPSLIPRRELLKKKALPSGRTHW